MSDFFTLTFVLTFLGSAHERRRITVSTMPPLLPEVSDHFFRTLFKEQPETVRQLANEASEYFASSRLLRLGRKHINMRQSY